MKKLLASLLSALLLAGLPAAATAQDAWAPTIDQNQVIDYPEDNRLHIVEPNSDNNHTFLRFLTKDWETVCQEVGPNWDCGSGKQGKFYGYIILPICGEIVENCIDGVNIYQDGQAPIAAELQKTIAGAMFKGFPNRGIPSGGGVSIFRGSVEHSPGLSDYVVMAKIRATFEKTKTQIEQLEISVVPVRAKPEPLAKSPRFIESGCDNDFENSSCVDAGLFPNNHLCVYQEDGVCGIAQEFAEGTRVGVKLKLSNQIAGWFKGRLEDPQLSVAKVDSRYSSVSIDAKPASIGRFYHESVPSKTGEPSAKDVLGYAPGTGFGLSRVEANRPDAFKVIKAYRSWVKDTASGVSTVWSVGSINKFDISRTGDPKGCFQDQSRLIGLVTTNATVFEQGAPVLRSGFLNYKVAGMHYLPDGVTEALGSYDLVMRSDVARCLYGFSKAPISASISISGEGDKNIATTVVSEKNGWLKLAAYGFTFSEKTIKVKLTQKKTTITCVAPGKKAKKVTAVSPKCPKGFKRR